MKLHYNVLLYPKMTKRFWYHMDLLLAGYKCYMVYLSGYQWITLLFIHTDWQEISTSSLFGQTLVFKFIGVKWANQIYQKLIIRTYKNNNNGPGCCMHVVGDRFIQITNSPKMSHSRLRAQHHDVLQQSKEYCSLLPIMSQTYLMDERLIDLSEHCNKLSSYSKYSEVILDICSSELSCWISRLGRLLAVG